MFELPVEDLAFVVCTLIGGGLLLITVLLDDVLQGFFEAFDIDTGTDVRISATAGAGLVLIAAGLSTFLWRRRGRLL